MTVAVAPPVPPAVADPADVRDAAAIDARDWPDRPLTGPTAQGRDGRFQVVYRQSALDEIHLHGQTRTDAEVCGVLLGTGCRDAHGPYLLVEHAIRGTAAASRSTNVTFTAETWQQIQTVMDRDHPDKRMIGWYHTHPGFGIFLSGMDVFICDNFFNLPWQVAFVYDPVGGDEGNFVWRDNKPTREAVLLEDDVTPQAAAVPLIPVAEAMAGSDPADVRAAPSPASVEPDGDRPLEPTSAPALQSQVTELMERVRRLERRQKPLIVAVVFLIGFVAVCATQLTTPVVSPPAVVQMVQPPAVSPPAATPVTVPPPPPPPSASRPPPSPAGGSTSSHPAKPAHRNVPVQGH